MHRIILHANADEGFDTRVEAALALARVFGARLSCVHVRPSMTSAGDVYTAGLFTGTVPVSVVQQMRRDEEQFRKKCESRVASEDVVWDWTVRTGLPERELARESLLADLMVVSPLGSSFNGQAGETFLGRVLTSAHCPVLSAPAPSAPYANDGRILLLWNGSEEAARAMRGALPLLRRAQQVRVLTLGEIPADRPDAEAVAAYLAHAGIAAETRAAPEDGDIGTAIEEEATAFEAGLIVMGAYSRSRLAEIILGGATLSLIRQQRFPVLFRH